VWTISVCGGRISIWFLSC